jgi:hypothetical protein
MRLTPTAEPTLEPDQGATVRKASRGRGQEMPAVVSSTADIAKAHLRRELAQFTIGIEVSATRDLCQIYRNEPWHYELRPDGPHRRCPAMYADRRHDPRMRP